MAALSHHLLAFRTALSYAYTQGFYFLGYRASAAMVLVSIAGLPSMAPEHSGLHGY